MDITSYLLGKEASGGSTPVNLQEKSVTITTNGTTSVTPDEGYNGMSKVNITTNVTSSIIPNSISELNSNIITLANSFKNYYLTIPNTYEVYTDNGVILYTPNSTYNNYAIQKRQSMKYRIIWFPYDSLTYYNGIYQTRFISNGNSSATENTLINNAPTYQVKDQNGYFYYSAEYDTIAECIEKIQSNQTTYTLAANTFLGAAADSPYVIPYSNVTIFKEDDSSIILSKRISSNETIVEL